MVPPPNSRSKKPPCSPAARGRAVLLAAAVVGERDQQRLALRGALGGAALQLLELVLHAVEHVALLLDAAVERPALRAAGC